MRFVQIRSGTGRQPNCATGLPGDFIGEIPGLRLFILCLFELEYAVADQYRIRDNYLSCTMRDGLLERFLWMITKPKLPSTLHTK
jgi:hypothetical protein